MSGGVGGAGGILQTTRMATISNPFPIQTQRGWAHPQSPLDSFSKYGDTVSQLAHAPFDRSRPISLPVQQTHTSVPTITSLCKQLLV